MYTRNSTGRNVGTRVDLETAKTSRLSPSFLSGAAASQLRRLDATRGGKKLSTSTRSSARPRSREFEFLLGETLERLQKLRGWETVRLLQALVSIESLHEETEFLELLVRHAAKHFSNLDAQALAIFLPLFFKFASPATQSAFAPQFDSKFRKKVYGWQCADRIVRAGFQLAVHDRMPLSTLNLWLFRLHNLQKTENENSIVKMSMIIEEDDRDANLDDEEQEDDQGIAPEKTLQESETSVFDDDGDKGGTLALQHQNHANVKKKRASSTMNTGEDEQRLLLLKTVAACVKMDLRCLEVDARSVLEKASSASFPLSRLRQIVPERPTKYAFVYNRLAEEVSRLKMIEKVGEASSADANATNDAEREANNRSCTPLARGSNFHFPTTSSTSSFISSARSSSDGKTKTVQPQSPPQVLLRECTIGPFWCLTPFSTMRTADMNNIHPVENVLVDWEQPWRLYPPFLRIEVEQHIIRKRACLEEKGYELILVPNADHMG
ncbi:unnamed protein product [Amoebophrya sp. A25]|nr:unnamed protein product [Amoebophrya sp. A25]|eukprot:GSA25T00026049001.1